MTLRIWQSIPAIDFVEVGQCECPHCDLKDIDCLAWMSSFGTFCTDADLGRSLDDDRIYKEIRKKE